MDHSIGAMPMAERKLCAGVDGNICWVKFTQILLNDFSMQMSPKTVNYCGKNVGFGVGFGYHNNTRGW